MDADHGSPHLQEQHLPPRLISGVIIADSQSWRIVVIFGANGGIVARLIGLTHDDRECPVRPLEDLVVDHQVRDEVKSSYLDGVVVRLRC
jgi:hypothetical protein